MIRFHKALSDLMVPKDSITPNPENDNNGDVDEVIASIMKVGCYRPIYVSANTGHILAGHTLYAALLELGALMVPALYLDADSPDELRILLGDNQIARLARRDDMATLALLEQLNTEDNGLIGTGFHDRDLENLRELARRTMDTDLRLDLSGSENLTHTITCPNCSYSWVRGNNDEGA